MRVPDNSCSKPLPQRLLVQHFRELALRMALHCVRNTVIENYHAAGKLTDPEMKALNQEVANKIYSFLQIMLNPYYAGMRTKAFGWLYAPDWDQPVFDKSFLIMLKAIKEKIDPPV
jgi:hypothetical protein